MRFGENLIFYHFEKFPLKLTFRTEKVILFGADRFDSWIKVFHLKVSLRFEDGIVETNGAIYECNYVLIVGRYVVFLGNVWSYQTRSHYMKWVNIKKSWENDRII